MRILYMGTATFAVPSLVALMKAGHEILGVVTQPDKPVGRKRILEASAVKSAALALGVAVFQPERLRRDKSFHKQVREMAPDLVAYAAYGQIIPPAFLEIPRLGCWNVHGSLLPAYRGAAPIQWSIINGNAATGVCVMIAEAGLDTGPVLTSREMDILSMDTTATLGARMADIGAQLLVETISRWERDDVTPLQQDESKVTFAPAIEKNDARVVWHQSAAVLDCFVRGMNPKPGAWTMWRGLDFKIWVARPADAVLLPPGGLAIAGKAVFVATGEGSLELKVVQPSGKKPMVAIDWARGLHGDERFE